MTEKLGRCRFDLIPVWKTSVSNYSFDKSKVAVLFHYAILNDEAVSKVSKFIEKAKSKGVDKIVLLSFYSTPAILAKLTANEELQSYVLVKDPNLKAVKTMIMNESMQFKTPVADDYDDCVTEQLSYISH